VEKKEPATLVQVILFLEPIRMRSHNY